MKSLIFVISGILKTIGMVTYKGFPLNLFQMSGERGGRPPDRRDPGGAGSPVFQLGVGPVVGELLRPTVVGPAEVAQGGVVLARVVEGGGPVEGGPRPGGSLCGKLEAEGEGSPNACPWKGWSPSRGLYPI
jgi:hypothetical protein